jgi:NAD-dependent deacetylase
MKKKIVFFTGAGVSAESGIKTFRDSDGLWEEYNVMDVATKDGWRRNRELVLEFYNKRHAQLDTVMPNMAHNLIAQLEYDQEYEVLIITQNVDNLHERAGSKNIIHLHGELTKKRSSFNPTSIFDWPAGEDIKSGDTAPDGSQLRPHIVWFGEAVPEYEKAALQVDDADMLVVIGSSLQVYPAAGIVDRVDERVPIYVIDPGFVDINANNIFHIKEKATDGMKTLLKKLKNEH